MVLVFGATGYSGRLVVEQLSRRGLPVRAAARSEEKLAELKQSFPAIETVRADVEDPASVVAAAQGCALLITTVGPYTKFGAVAAEAALAAGVPYIDITGEPAWLLRVHDEYAERAAAEGIAMIPAFGYDYVPGNLGGAIALAASGDAVRIDIGYFLASRGERSTKSFSRGTLESLKASSGAESFAFRDGALERFAPRREQLEFAFAGETLSAVAIGGTEHFFLPQIATGLREVNVGLGWFQPGDTKPQPNESAPADGPTEQSRAAARTRVVAEARDDGGELLARVDVDGPNPYDLSGLLSAWAAQEILAGRAPIGTGMLGPVSAFGLEALRSGCAEIGLTAS